MQPIGKPLFCVRQPGHFHAHMQLTPDLAKGAQMLVTMGCGETCPYIPGLRRLDWQLADPKDKPSTEVNEIRDEIRSRVVTLLEELQALKSH